MWREKQELIRCQQMIEEKLQTATNTVTKLTEEISVLKSERQRLVDINNCQFKLLCEKEEEFAAFVKQQKLLQANQCQVQLELVQKLKKEQLELKRQTLQSRDEVQQLIGELMKYQDGKNHEKIELMAKINSLQVQIKQMDAEKIEDENKHNEELRELYSYYNERVDFLEADKGKQTSNETQ
jgi:phage-related minor tail protein